MSVRPAKTQISLGIRPVWSESSLSAWRKLGFLTTHWAEHTAKTDQTGRMPRLIWVFAGRTLILLVLSWGGSFAQHSATLASSLDQSDKKSVKCIILSKLWQGVQFKIKFKGKKQTLEGIRGVGGPTRQPPVKSYFISDFWCIYAYKQKKYLTICK